LEGLDEAVRISWERREGGREGTYLSLDLLGVHVVTRLEVIGHQPPDPGRVVIRPRGEADNPTPSLDEAVPEIIAPPERGNGAHTRDHHLGKKGGGGREGGRGW